MCTRFPYLMSRHECTLTRSPSFTRRLLRATLLIWILPSSTSSELKQMRTVSRLFFPLFNASIRIEQPFYREKNDTYRTIIVSPRKSESVSIVVGWRVATKVENQSPDVTNSMKRYYQSCHLRLTRQQWDDLAWKSIISENLPLTKSAWILRFLGSENSGRNVIRTWLGGGTTWIGHDLIWREWSVIYPEGFYEQEQVNARSGRSLTNITKSYLHVVIPAFPFLLPLSGS